MIDTLVFGPERLKAMKAILTQKALEEGKFPLACCQLLAVDAETGALIPGGIFVILGQQLVTEEADADANGNGHDKPEELPAPEIIQGTTTIG